MGIHLHPLNNRLNNLFRLLWNVILNIFLYCCMYLFDPYTAKGYTVDHRKPLHLLLYFDVFILFPVAYLLCILYYHFTGQRIVAELSDDLLSSSFAQEGKQRVTTTTYSAVVIVLVFSLIHLNFFLTHGFVLQQHLHSIKQMKSLLSSLLSLVTVYVIYINWYLVLFLVHYYKTATYLALKSISRQQLQKEISVNEFRKTVKQIRHLAALNRRLNCLLSPPLFTFLLIFTVDGVASISLSEYIATFESYLHILVMLLYIAYLAYLSNRTQSELQTIVGRCKSALEFEKEEGEEVEMKERERKSLQIYLQEIDLHFEAFQLNVFQMCTVNFAFISTTVLVGFGYCVFIIQTSR